MSLAPLEVVLPLNWTATLGPYAIDSSSDSLHNSGQHTLQSKLIYDCVIEPALRSKSNQLDLSPIQLPTRCPLRRNHANAWEILILKETSTIPSWRRLLGSGVSTSSPSTCTIHSSVICSNQSNGRVLPGILSGLNRFENDVLKLLSFTRLVKDQ